MTWILYEDYDNSVVRGYRRTIHNNTEETLLLDTPRRGVKGERHALTLPHTLHTETREYVNAEEPDDVPFPNGYNVGDTFRYVLYGDYSLERTWVYDGQNWQ